VRYTELAAGRFEQLWGDWPWTSTTWCSLYSCSVSCAAQQLTGLWVSCCWYLMRYRFS